MRDRHLPRSSILAKTCGWWRLRTTAACRGRDSRACGTPTVRISTDSRPPMDYTLTTRKDAFTDAAYKESRRGYKLYAVLLATTLDQRFVAEYLSLFYELHALTGEEVLVLGVNPTSDQRAREEEARPVHIMELKSVATTLGHGEFEYAYQVDHAHESAEHFLRFMRAQTAESYALARFLGIRTDQFPAMVFFEDLARPSEMVVWPLGEMPASQFARRLRHLVEEVRERCAWRALDTIPKAARMVELLRQKEISQFNYDIPVELRDAAKALSELRYDLEPYERALRIYEKTDKLQVAFKELRATPGLRVPLENVGKTVDRLVTGDVEHIGFGHVIAHERRWRGRLPEGTGV